MSPEIKKNHNEKFSFLDLVGVYFSLLPSPLPSISPPFLPSSSSFFRRVCLRQQTSNNWLYIFLFVQIRIQ